VYAYTFLMHVHAYTKYAYAYKLAVYVGPMYAHAYSAQKTLIQFCLLFFCFLLHVEPLFNLFFLSLSSRLSVLPRFNLFTSLMLVRVFDLFIYMNIHSHVHVHALMHRCCGGVR